MLKERLLVIAGVEPELGRLLVFHNTHVGSATRHTDSNHAAMVSFNRTPCHNLISRDASDRLLVVTAGGQGGEMGDEFMVQGEAAEIMLP